VPVVHKRAWWNLLLANPAGYVPDEALVSRVELALPGRRYLAIGPDWLRGWEAAFLVPLVIASLLLKLVFRIH
jgi:hypothetical protein